MSLKLYRFPTEVFFISTPSNGGNNAANPDIYPQGPEEASGWVTLNYTDGPSVTFSKMLSFSGGGAPVDPLFMVSISTPDEYKYITLHWYVEEFPLTTGTYTCKFKDVARFYDEAVDANVSLEWITEANQQSDNNQFPLVTTGLLTITSCERFMAKNLDQHYEVQAFYILDGFFEIKNIYYTYRYRYEKIDYDMALLGGKTPPDLNGYRNLYGSFHLEGWCQGESLSLNHKNPAE